MTGDTSLDLGTLFELHSERVFGYLTYRCGNRAVAEELMAETFISAQKMFDRGVGHEVNVAWLLMVARRRLIDHWRSNSRANRRFEQLKRETRPVPPPPHDGDDAVDVALGSLSDRQRAALVLRYVDGFSTSEVADALNASYKATESLLGRARQAFRTAYEAEKEGFGDHDGR